jgi:hypothetical protein
MKTAVLPATRVSPALRKRVEALLDPGETVSAFIESAVTLHAQARIAQRQLVQRGLAAERADDWVSPGEVFTAVRKAARRGRRRANP